MTVSDYLLPVNLYNHLSEKLSPSSLLITFAVFIDRNMLTFQKKETGYISARHCTVKHSGEIPPGLEEKKVTSCGLRDTCRVVGGSWRGGGWGRGVRKNR